MHKSLSGSIKQYIGGISMISLSIIQGILLIPIYFQYLSKEDYGIYITLAAYATTLTFLDLGVSNFLPISISNALARKDHDATAISINGALTLSILTIASLALLHPIIIRSATHILPYSILSHENFKTLFTLLIIGTSFTLSTGSTGSILLGIHMPGPHMINSIVGTVLSMCITLLLLTKGNGILSFGYGYLAANTIPTLLNTITLLKLRNNKTIQLGLSLNASIKTLKRSIHLAPSIFANTFLQNFDIIIIGTLADPEFTTHYVIIKKAADIGILLISRASHSLNTYFSHISIDRQAAEKHQIKFIIFTTSLAAFFLSNYISLNPTFIKVWLNIDVAQSDTKLILAIALLAFSRILLTTIYNLSISAQNLLLASKATAALLTLIYPTSYLITQNFDVPTTITCAAIAYNSTTLYLLHKTNILTPIAKSIKTIPTISIIIVIYIITQSPRTILSHLTANPLIILTTSALISLATASTILYILIKRNNIFSNNS
ncbi:hypothetical protein QEH56_16565 [Pelagicoccus enzymogenes]|uniref:lipopolysaccharide biosynthesis protein n=1 Tax=Pelagicoccus enzymogenes TaxID=2773457 RepID=UPI00280C86ED|nr:hypothetical protein [Pelagicoccus enzymogenes]MDQ8199777.1 hypothetical protein [Pelagicoccus enzymogenes]